MARYRSSIRSSLLPEDAFAYMADFSNAAQWDPSVSRASRVDDGPIGPGSSFDLIARFGGRNVALHYTIVEFEPPRRVVLEARRPGFVSRDTIAVEPSGTGSQVDYDALLSFGGLRRLAEPIMQRVFARVGARATEGLRTGLNP